MVDEVDGLLAVARRGSRRHHGVLSRGEHGTVLVRHGDGRAGRHWTCKDGVLLIMHRVLGAGGHNGHGQTMRELWVWGERSMLPSIRARVGTVIEEWRSMLPNMRQTLGIAMCMLKCHETFFVLTVDPCSRHPLTQHHTSVSEGSHLAKGSN